MPVIHRDFPTALVNYQDMYGLMGTTPTPVHSKRSTKASSQSSSSAPSSFCSSSSSFSFSRMLRRKERKARENSEAPTRSRRSSIDSQRTLTSTSTPSTSKSSSSPRDNGSAFGTLSSTYGLGSAIPTPIQTTFPSKTTRSSHRKSKHSSRDSSLVIDEQEANLGKLLSQYGAGSGPSMMGARR